MFSRDLRDAVTRGELTVSVRLWSRPQVNVGGRYPTAGVLIEIDSLEVLPFSAVTDDDVRASGETDREALRVGMLWAQRRRAIVSGRSSRHSGTGVRLSEDPRGMHRVGRILLRDTTPARHRAEGSPIHAVRLRHPGSARSSFNLT